MLKIVGMLSVFNDEDIVEEVIKYYLSQRSNGNPKLTDIKPHRGGLTMDTILIGKKGILECINFLTIKKWHKKLKNFKKWYQTLCIECED